MVHKQGNTPVSNQRLQRRDGVYYYRRRIPHPLVSKFGKTFVQVSLHTTSLKEAKKLRTLRDLEWDAKFAACSSRWNGGDGPAAQTTAHGHAAFAKTNWSNWSVTTSRGEIGWRRSRERRDPENPAQRAEMTIEGELWSKRIHQTTRKPSSGFASRQEVLKPAGKSFDDPALPGEMLAELIRRALLELTRRRHARLADDHSRSFFDQLFNPSRPARRRSASSPNNSCGSSRRMAPSMGWAPRGWTDSGPP